jgi:hypothetical protein
VSYSIYYDRAFVRVEEKFIPLANSGSNNCYQFYNNREVPEKNWNVLNWKRSSQIIFSAEEIREIAKDYDSYNQTSGMLYKSRNRAFAPGEFERWVVNGMKNAYTIEEYYSFGNSFYVLDYSPEQTKDWREHRFKTTTELLDIIRQLGEVVEIEVKMENNRAVYRPVKHRQHGHTLNANDLQEYYILAGEGKSEDIQGQTIYFAKLTRYGFRYFSYRNSNGIKIFRSAHEAERYAKKYAKRLEKFATFKPELVSKS